MALDTLDTLVVSALGSTLIFTTGLNEDLLDLPNATDVVGVVDMFNRW